MTNANKFKNIFGLYVTELWSMPEKDFLKWLNSEAMNYSEFPNNSDTISRQAAFDAFWKLEAELRPSAIDAVLDMLKNLPSAQPQRTGYQQAKNVHPNIGKYG